MKFDELSESLNLSKQSTDEGKLRLLKAWCEKNISSDLRFYGSAKEEYDNYSALATIYLEQFLPKLVVGLDHSVAEFNGRNAIQEMAHSGLDRVLLSSPTRVDVLNQPDRNGMTPLHLASVAGHVNTVAALLSFGADPTKTNKSSKPPIFSALFLPIVYEGDLKENKIKIARMFMDKAPETLLQQDTSGDTVLHLMASSGFSTLMSELLKTNAILASRQNNHSHYPVHTAILNYQMECARILLQEKDADTLADSQGRVPLHYAARYSGKDMVALCCEASKDMNPLDREGKTPFLLAAEAGNIEAMAALLSRGAQAESTDANGFTAIHLAVQGRHQGAVAWLLKNTTIDINACDNDHQTALSLCNKSGDDGMRDFLLGEGAADECRPGM